MIPKICLIIPAAGLSRRHPPNKLLIELNQKTVIETTISTFVDFRINIFVVTGYQQEIITPILNKQFGEQIKIIENPNYADGMATSIQAAIQVLSDKYQYWGFCNGDKPFIQKETVKTLLKALSDHQPLILSPSFKEQTGHPIFFSTKLKEEFLSLSGDIGGRQILQDHIREALILPLDDEGIVLDMDLYLDKKHG